MTGLNTIAIIDDSALDRRLCAMMIARCELARDCVGFDSAEAALEAWQNGACAGVDMILLDVNLPGLSGIDFLEACAGQQLRDLPPIFVMLTQPLLRRDHERAVATGRVTGWIDKPLTRDALRRHAASLTRNMRTQPHA